MGEYYCTTEGVSYKRGNVFSNEGLLELIFEHLACEDLKTVRLVNHLWSAVATKVLIHKFRTKPIQISHDKVTLLNWKKDGNPTMSMNAFSKFIGKSMNFPSTILLDKLYQKLLPDQKEHLVNLFKSYGHIFKSMKFTQMFTEGNRAFIEQLLSQMLPNLQVLTVEKCTDTLFLNTIDIQALQLRKLKTLHLHPSAVSHPFISTVLQSSRMLENIYLWVHDSGSSSNDCYFNAEYSDRYYYEKVIAAYQILEKQNALRLLKNIDLIFKRPYLDHLENILSDEHLTNVKDISRLFFHEGSSNANLFYWSRVGKMLNIFFWKNCKSPEKMSKVNPLGQFPEDSLTLPVFPNVLRLDCACVDAEYKSNSRPRSLRNIELARIFPNLVHITISQMYDPYEELCTSILFRGKQSPLLTVQSLKFAYSFRVTTLWVEFVHRVFSNVVKADFGTLKDFNGASEFLWRLKNLEELKLRIKINDKEQFFHKYDSAFTGLSPNTVKILYNTSEERLEKFNATNLKALRSRPSITNLQRLRKLKVKFLDDRNVYSRGCFHAADSTLESEMLLTHISGRLAFKICPQLRSNVYISLIHWATHYLRCRRCCKAQDAFRTLVPFVRPISYDIHECILFDYKEPTNEPLDEDEEYYNFIDDMHYYAKKALEQRLLIRRQSHLKQRKHRKHSERKPRRAMEQELKYANASSYKSSQPKHFRLRMGRCKSNS